MLVDISDAAKQACGCIRMLCCGTRGLTALLCVCRPRSPATTTPASPFWVSLAAAIVQYDDLLRGTVLSPHPSVCVAGEKHADCKTYTDPKTGTSYYFWYPGESSVPRTITKTI